MKILLIRSEGNQTHINDFMSDLLLHGLRQLYGPEVIDYPGCWYMYPDEITNRKYDIDKIWGKGFTINSTLKNYNSNQEKEDTSSNIGYVIGIIIFVIFFILKLIN